MVIVAFQPGEKYAVNYTTLDQYDYGQVLRIQGLKLPKTVEVHFSTQETGGTSITRVGVTKDGVTDVLIPDSVLENGDTTQNYSIFAFVYITDTTSGKTEYRARLEVKARPKPEVPGGSDNPDVFRDAVLAVRESALKAEEAQRQADEDAKKTTEDRKTVEDAVESVKDITEQVARVEELSRNAQEAATQTQNAAQGIITDRKQIQKNTTEIGALKEGIPSKLSELQEDGMHRTVTDAEKENWNAKSDFSGNYNDLENKPAIPTVPDALPNPHALTFSGAITAEYDGSGAVMVTIPDAQIERIEKLGTDTVVELQPNKLYIFPEMESLTYTLAHAADAGVANEYHFVFKSGATPTEVIHPQSVSVGNFTVDANKIYEVSVMENLLTSQNWEVAV